MEEMEFQEAASNSQDLVTEYQAYEWSLIMYKFVVVHV